MSFVPVTVCRCILNKFKTSKCCMHTTPIRHAKKLKNQQNALWGWLIDKHRTSPLSQQPEQITTSPDDTVMVPRDYKYVYPEFLPTTVYEHRDRIKEMLERRDMYKRRSAMEIPEFYVGSILAVTVADQHAPTRSTRFVGICIHRENDGLKTSFTLRNHIIGNGVEIRYEMYSPLLQKIEVLKLEKRLDDELFYLRDCPAEYSTVPFDMEPIHLPKGSAVPLNKIKVPLGPRPWEKKWDRQNVKGLQEINRFISKKEARRIERSAKPWEKYDIMKQYRESINEDETAEVMKEVFINKQKIDQAAASAKQKTMKKSR